MSQADKSGRPSLAERIVQWTTDRWRYCTDGVWRDTADKPMVHLVMVPALAMLFAIARGFGFQNLVESEILSFFPSQHTALKAAFGFVDSYLAQTSEGVFVGIGVVVLLWTLISLLGSVEDSFNNIWNITSGRSIFRKMTDYLAILLILPVFMICSASLSLRVLSTLPIRKSASSPRQ